jgi:hypothetical protein
MQLDAFDLVESLSRQIILATMRASDHRNILNHEQVLALSVDSSNPAYAGTLLTANVTYHESSIQLPLTNFSHNLYDFVGRQGEIHTFNVQRRSFLREGPDYEH